jgi:hypothetical protein
VADWIDVANLLILLFASGILYAYMRRKQAELQALEERLAKDPPPQPQAMLEAYSGLIGETTIELRTAARILERTRATMRRGIKGSP